MKKIELELKLSSLEKGKNAKAHLEQYFTPTDIAASLLYTALGEGNISGRTVADLGTGGGIFAIGASLLGAVRVYGIDIDPEMIKLARRNSRKLGAEVELLNMDVSEFNIPVDTVIMNPPFGSQVRNSDLPFIEKALSISKNFYILFNYKTSDFLEKFVKGRGEIVWETEISFRIPHTFEFHRKEVKEIKAVIARVMVCQ